MNIRMLLSITIITSPYFAHTMAHPNVVSIAHQPLTVYEVGGIARDDYVRLMVDDGWSIDDEGDGSERVNIERVGTKAADLGQLNGTLLDIAIEMDPRDPQSDIVLYGTGAGAATAINYVAMAESIGAASERIKALILESSFASGNSAIDCIVKNIPNRWMPHTYYTTPYLTAQGAESCYDPAAEQPIKSIAKIPNDMLVILAHSKENPWHAYEDSCALYYGLRAQGNPNAYLITKEGEAREEILHGTIEAPFIKNMLKKHKIIPGKYDATMDVSPYQPDHKQFEKLYKTLLAKEKMHETLGHGVTVVKEGAAVVRQGAADIAAIMNRPEIRDNLIMPVALMAAGSAIVYAGQVVRDMVGERGHNY